MFLKSGLEVTQDHSNWYHFGCGFLFAFRSNHSSSLHHFRDKVRYSSKIASFSYRPCIRRPAREFTSKYCHPIWYEKTRMLGLADDKIFWGYVQRYRQNTGVWRTDGRKTAILQQHSPRYAYASRGKNVQTLKHHSHTNKHNIMIRIIQRSSPYRIKLEIWQLIIISTIN